jgi:hypothetical protein
LPIFSITRKLTPVQTLSPLLISLFQPFANEQR